MLVYSKIYLKMKYIIQTYVHSIFVFFVCVINVYKQVVYGISANFLHEEFLQF